MRKKIQKITSTEESRLRELADTVNPLGQLLKKNQERAENNAEKVAPFRDPRLPLAGTLLERKYRGVLLSVKVLETGFEYEGKYYKTLSAVASAITGHHQSGYHFFGL